MRRWRLPGGMVAVHLGGDAEGHGGIVLTGHPGVVDNPKYLKQPYVRRLRILADAEPPKPGEVYCGEVRHENWCGALRGTGLCTCDADVALRVVRSDGRQVLGGESK